jgi:hypothetical protein
VWEALDERFDGCSHDGNGRCLFVAAGAFVELVTIVTTLVLIKSDEVN